MKLNKFQFFAGALLLSSLATGCWTTRSAGGEESTPPPPRPLSARHYTPHKLVDLADERINESSGLAASRRYPGHLWTHNDSGDKPRLFLLTSAGETVAVVNLENANAFDWEDMAVAGEGENAWIYAGDIGDNFRWRANLNVFRFREPELDTTERDQEINLRAEEMVLKYTGPQSDAETLIATPDGTLLIVTKVPNASQLWRTPQPFQDGAQQTLQALGKYSFGANETAKRAHLATGGDLSPDGRRFAVVTYTQLYEWLVPHDENGAPDWEKMWQSTPTISPLPSTKQTEAVCYSADGEKLFITSEQQPAPLYEMVAEADK